MNEWISNLFPFKFFAICCCFFLFLISLRDSITIVSRVARARCHWRAFSKFSKRKNSSSVLHSEQNTTNYLIVDKKTMLIEFEKSIYVRERERGILSNGKREQNWGWMFSQNYLESHFFSTFIGWQNKLTEQISNHLMQWRIRRG